MEFLIDHWDFSTVPAQPCAGTLEKIAVNQWYHCHREGPGIREWLTSNHVPNSMIDSFLAQDTRPSFLQYDEDNFLLILRGINLNADANPEDMLSLRLLYVNGTLISTRKIPSKTVSKIREQLSEQNGPKALSELVVSIIDGLSFNIDGYLSKMDLQITEFEGQLELSDELIQSHKALLKIKRFIKPQQYAIDDLFGSEITLVKERSIRLSHSVNTIIRINETLDFYLGEIEIIKGELRQYHAEKMNRNTYLFSVIAAIFLPTSFLTGLFGVNIGGIPGIENGDSFLFFCLSLLVIFLFEYWILRRLQFIKMND
jgi:zinc transporter